jgi:transposase InsO family protein
MRFQFIDDHRKAYPVTLMCRVLAVTRSGYYAWRERPPSAREMANQKLLEMINAVHKKSRGCYGSPRIYQALRQLEIRCGRKRVARLMREHGIRGKGRRRDKRTTDSEHAQPIAPNQLQQDFTATTPNEKWCADITYVATREGWLYLAIIIDLYSRFIVGWAIGNDLSRHLVLAALRMATRRRRPGPGLIHHSDRGSQYASGDYQRMLASWKILPSMSATGNCYDNAPAESWFATLKVECVDIVYDTKEEARRELFEYMEVFYNRRRLHSKLGYLSPAAFELQHHQLVSESLSPVH